MSISYSERWSTYDLFTVVPALQATPDYAAGDVLFAPTEIPNFFKDDGSAAQIMSICIIDKQIVATHEFTLYFTHSSTALGSLNATAGAAVGVLEEIQATIPIYDEDWIAGGGAGSVDLANIATITSQQVNGSATVHRQGIGAIVKGSNYGWGDGSPTQSIYISAIAGEAMNVASTSDLLIKIGVKYL